MADPALALAETRPKNKHGQLCPVWAQRMRKGRHAVTIADCDCWILADARIDAAVVLEAANPAPAGLDVERLARAMARAAEVGPHAHLDPDDAEDHWPSYMDEAAEYVREYARLANTRESDGG